jgi:sortase A
MRRLIGVLLILAGLSGLGYIGWQFWGTDWQSARIQRGVLEETEQAWVRGKDPAKVEWGTIEGIVRIPSFGKDYAIPLMEFAGPDPYDALHAGFGHMPDSAKVGRVGNFQIIAHRTTRNEPLRHMPDLEPGDKVIIETRQRIYTYRLTSGGDDLRLPFTAGWPLDPELPDNPVPGGVEPKQKPGQRLLTMVTCAELFHSDDRLVAFGELLRIEQKIPASSAS